MTQGSLQTRCPKCETRFRVTEEQLGVARGKVRCGHCMSVFNAIEHQVSPSSAAPAKPSPSSPTTSETPAAKESVPAEEEDLVFQDNPDEDATESSYTGSKLTFDEDELSDSFRSIGAEDRHGFVAETDDDDNELVDESWAESILDDEPVTSPKPRTEVKAEPKPEPKPEPEAQPEPESEPEPEPEEFSANPEDEFGEPDFNALDDELNAPAPQQEQAAGNRLDSDNWSIDGVESQGGNSLLDDFENSASEPLVSAPAAARRQRNRDNPYLDLRHEPISVGKPERRWLRRLLWLFIILGLLGVLISQIVYFQFDRLSAIPQLRPFYEKGCELAGCELEPLVDVGAIQSRKLFVRTNPENRAQLVVDAVIINRAEFEQPFPSIALTFSNLNGDVVAQSLFSPEEYLAGDARDLTTMPMETPVQIRIDIRDPGKDAVNYNLGFRAR